jgi:uncharacterized membrane protein YdjX (TVP38/TMEM64 family)/Fe-S oxidoreductase
MDRRETIKTAATPNRSSLEARTSRTMTGCLECRICVNECAFLKKYGTPKEIVEELTASGDKVLVRAFECNLCGLCSELCSAGLDLDGLFLGMRQEAVDRGLGDFDEHKPLLAYERLGTSRRFTFYGIPGGCTTVFFPGCALAGTRPAAVKGMFAALKKEDPKIGVVLDCCMEPSRSLGRERHARSMLEEMGGYLVDRGVREVLVGCPSCHSMFTAFSQGLTVKTIYEALADAGSLIAGQVQGTVVVHDSCVGRNLEHVHEAVRRLLKRQGLTVEEMEHTGKKTLCCGQGGAVNLLAPDLAAVWGLLRKKEARGRRIVTYCAGCAHALGSHSATSHIADLIFEPEKALAGKLKATQGPFTYLNRLFLKRAFSRMGQFTVTRERTFFPESKGRRKRSWKLAVLFAALTAAIISVHFSGAMQYLEQGRLRALISGYGVLAPIIYMLIYTLAPVLFLPGLPITIVGGILFGPFWGVVYTIFGATCGATLAFLTARYGAREWVLKKLSGPRWEKLDGETAKHGWKAVAVARLIPAFPFNLVNYAFGLTNVPLSHYIATTFICMLPACIAFIVFSSSLLDLIRGNISPAALIGVMLIAAVSLIPLFYRRLRRKRAAETAGD